jgi:hypothetical protein
MIRDAKKANKPDFRCCYQQIDGIDWLSNCHCLLLNRFCFNDNPAGLKESHLTEMQYLIIYQQQRHSRKIFINN